jgi:ABC-type lipoprotein release transport system permease subunit
MSTLLARHRNIIDFALSSLLRRKAKNLSLLAVYTLIVVVIASVMLFINALKREAAAMLKDAPDMVVQKIVAGRHDLMPVSRGGAIGGITGVRSVTQRLWGYYYDAVSGANYTLTVTDGGQPAPGSIQIGNAVARLTRFAEGDSMPLRTYRGETLLLRVEHVLPAEAELVAADLIVVSENDFRALFNFPAGFATDLAVSVGNPRELATIAAKIVTQFPDTRPIMKSEILRTYDSIFDWRGGMMVVMVAAAVLAFIIFAWDKASGLSSEERREIGILKSIGWETSDVLLLKFWEGAIISLTAFLFGTVLAYCHVFFFSASLFEHALKGWAVLYPQFRLAPVINAYQLSVLFFLTVVPYTAATIIPSWRSASVDPDSSMR